MNLVNEGVLPPDELDDRDERREEQERARSRETLAEIVADIRERAENAMRNGERLVHNEAVANMLTFVADRIEAAAKRDEERAAEHATRHAEAVARDNCRDCVHNPRGKNYGGGNAAAMCEALVQCELFLGNVSRHGHPTLNPGDKCTACDGVDELRGLVVRALAAPPRNCDVGTPEEQRKRFKAFCRDRQYGSCDGCPIPKKGFCTLQWAQMPYEASDISRAHRAGEKTTTNQTTRNNNEQ